MNNTARVVKIHSIEKHPNADRLQIVRLFGTQVITDMSAKQGDMMIYFDSNLQLSKEYCCANNLYRHCELNQDNTKTGYIDDNGRVKALKMRGEMTDGVLMPLRSLDFTGNVYDDHTYEKNFPEGTEFNDWNNVNICSKYIVPLYIPSTPGIREKKNRGKQSHLSPMFVEHWDTDQYMKSSRRIPPDTLVYIEEKIHGTSNRTGRVIVTKELTWLKRLVNLLIGKDTFLPYSWKIINGTRRTVERYDIETAFHDPSIREYLKILVAPNLHKGEEIYVEIAGYENSGRWIQKDFPYGADIGECRYFLYRVSHNNEDGIVVDLSRLAVYARAAELGLEATPLLATYYYTGSRYSKKKMDALVISLAQGKSTLDPNTLREGVVVWFMTKYGKWTCLKYKQDAFKIKESKLKDEGIGDIEDTL